MRKVLSLVDSLTCSEEFPLNLMKSMRILVTGKHGQVGKEMSRQLSSLDGVVSVGREECDLSDEAAIRDLVRQIKPAVIVNTAAYTAVDRAETERDLCFAINATAPRVLAEEAERLGARLIHYSTDYVFDGQKPTPYLESDSIAPMSVYGASKAAGEEAIAASGAHYQVLRTSWVYAGEGKNFLLTMLRLGAERPELKVVDDQVGAPTSATAIAAATIQLFERADAPSGVYHMTAGGATSWYGFANAIFDSGILTSVPRLRPIPSSEYPTPARRPANSVLANDKFAATFGFRLSPWQDQLHDVLTGMHTGVAQ
jgi:dTDP-4-dehydrorhamnose reductase